MSIEGKDKIESSDFAGEIELYGDPSIASSDARVPKFLKATYLFLPIWGVMTFYFLWNGSLGWFDRGYWRELQIAANTTFPIENQSMLSENIKLDQEELRGTQP